MAACGRGKESDARPDASVNADAGAAAHASASADASTGTAAHASASADATAGAAAGAQGDDDDASYLDSEARAAKAIGHTSIVFKVELTSGKKAAFKPASRRGPVRYKGEIAARRLGMALGLVNVPRAFFRTLDAAKLQDARGADEMLVHAGQVKGALIPWIDGLSFLAVDQAPLSTQWKQWLRRGESIPDDQRELARQLSTLVAFDYVTANWDRWSGGNVGIDKATGTLLFIDNDGAFFDTPPADGLRRNEQLLAGVDKFSRSLVNRLRALDDDALDRALGEETPGVPLLGAKALVGVHARRKRLLAVIDAKLGDAGDDATFAFP